MALVSRAVALSALVVLASASPATAATWLKVTGFGEPDSNTLEVGLARTANGTLNVLWSQDTSSDQHLVLNTQVSANGKSVTGPHTVFAYENGAGDTALLPTPEGGLRAFFAGLSPDDPRDEGMATATSADGVSWAVQPTLASDSTSGVSPVYAASGIGGTIWNNGTPMSVWGDSAPDAHGYHVGTNDQTPDVRFGHPDAENSATIANPGAATDSATGEVAVGWNDLDAGRTQIVFVQPTTNPWFPPGPRINAPGGEAIDGLHPVAMTGRSGDNPGIFVAYLRGTNPFDSRAAVWRIGAGSPMPGLPNTPDARFPGVAMSTDGRLWAFWFAADSDRIRAARSNQKATRFGATVVVKPPSGTDSVWALAGEGAPGGAVDIAAHVTRSDSDTGTYVTRVLPGITLKVKKKDDGTVVFKTSDAGEKLATKIKFAGQTKETGDDGKVTFAPNPGKYVAKATRDGYTPTKKRVKVPQQN